MSSLRGRDKDIAEAAATRASLAICQRCSRVSLACARAPLLAITRVSLFLSPRVDIYTNCLRRYL